MTQRRTRPGVGREVARRVLRRQSDLDGMAGGLGGVRGGGRGPPPTAVPRPRARTAPARCPARTPVRSPRAPPGGACSPRGSRTSRPASAGIRRSPRCAGRPRSRLGPPSRGVATLVRREARRRRLLDELLVPPLQRAVPLPDRDHPTGDVAQQLDLDVPRRADLALQVDRAVAERGQAPRTSQRRAPPGRSWARSTRRIPRPPPPAAALTSSGNPIASASAMIDSDAGPAGRPAPDRGSRARPPRRPTERSAGRAACHRAHRSRPRADRRRRRRHPRPRARRRPVRQGTRIRDAPPRRPVARTASITASMRR